MIRPYLSDVALPEHVIATRSFPIGDGRTGPGPSRCGGGGGGVYQQRRAFVENRPDVGKPPSENPWSKPVMRMPVKQVEPTTVSQSKPVLRCTPAMAAEMLLELKKAGIAAETVVLEIIGSN